jgi:hypothetical protein
MSKARICCNFLRRQRIGQDAGKRNGQYRHGGGLRVWEGVELARFLQPFSSPGSTHPQGPENKEDPFINSMMEKD